MPVNDRTHPRRDPCEASFCGNLIGLLDLLAETLQNDYHGNVVETADQNWEFDYVITEETEFGHHLVVSTRLYSEKKPGNIFYGREIKRTGNDLYLMWIDH